MYTAAHLGSGFFFEVLPFVLPRAGFSCLSEFLRFSPYSLDLLTKFLRSPRRITRVFLRIFIRPLAHLLRSAILIHRPPGTLGKCFLPSICFIFLLNWSSAASPDFVHRHRVGPLDVVMMSSARPGSQSPKRNRISRAKKNIVARIRNLRFRNRSADNPLIFFVSYLSLHVRLKVHRNLYHHYCPQPEML